MKSYRLLSISGSLRNGSYNTALLDNLARLLPLSVRPETAPLNQLPPFNPDCDRQSNQPGSVTAWKKAVASADALVIATPEYAHTIPGALKNALDWIVGSGELVGKPVAVISASPTHLGPDKAHQDLLYLIRLLSAEVIEDASFTLASVNKRIDPSGNITDVAVKKRLEQSAQAILTRLEKGISGRRQP